jgi:glycosyltransferase involved in cell wall biosynthesis
MTNILVNGYKSKTGGGRGILRTYLKMLSESVPDDSTYFVLTPDFDEYYQYSKSHLIIIDVPKKYEKNTSFFQLYYFYFPRILNELKITKILNFGDIIIPTDVSQIYLYDWPHAGYPKSPVWSRMDLSDWIYSKIKLFFFKRYLKFKPKILTQTNEMKDRISKIYNVKNIDCLPNAVSLDNFTTHQTNEFKIEKGKITLLYLTHYYPHKNIEIFLDLAKILKVQHSNIRIIITIDENQHRNASKLIRNIDDSELDQYIVNIGSVPSEKIASLYKICDGLLMPTLLESFSGSYVEAMYHRKPIFTSDLDFAHAVCGDSAYYFDPLDPLSIANTVQRAFADPASIADHVAKGVERLARMWTWDQVFVKLQSHLKHLGGLNPSVPTRID